MIRYFLKTLGAHLRAGPVLFALGVAGVALGVASVLSIQIVNRSAVGAFEGGVRAISGDADFSVVGRTPTLPDALYPRVLATPGVAAAWPVLRVEAAVTEAGRPLARGTWVGIVGLDLFSPVRVPWRTSPETRADPLATPGWVAVSPELARRLGVAVGDTLVVSAGSRPVRLTVGALVDFRRVTPLAGSRLVVMDVAQVQDRFGPRGAIGQIDVRVAAGADASAVRAGIERELGPAARTIDATERRDEAAALLGAFRLNLTALSLVSVFVGGFLVYASTHAALVRRREEFGVLRSLGATRGQTVGLILGEVVLLGTLGVGLGLPLGWAAARANTGVVSATLTNLYMLEEIESLRLAPGLLALAAVVGVGAAVAAALLPALDTSRSDPRALLAAWTLREAAEVRALPMLLAGAGVVGAVGAAWWLWLRDWKPGGFVLAAGVLVAVPLAAPWVVRVVTGRLGPGRFGLRYGVKAVGLRLATTAFAVAALAVAVSMLIGITLMVGSFRRTVDVWIRATLHADVYVTTEAWRRARGAAALDERIVDELRAVPEVAAIDRLRQTFLDTGSGRVSVVGIDMGAAARGRRFELLAGDPARALELVRDAGAVLVSEPLARRRGLAVGDRFRAVGPGGAATFPVAGIFYDYGNESGTVAMDRATMRRWLGPGPTSNVALYLRPGADPERVIDALRDRWAGMPLVFRSNAELRRDVFRVFDQTFAVTRLLEGMSLLIAAAGVTLTLLVLARERLSELALYRALGARRRQVFRVFLGQGIGIAAFGLVLGAVGGTALALVLVYVINRAYFGWTIALHWPWPELAAQAATILAAAAAASLYPAFRASRTSARELSRENV